MSYEQMMHWIATTDTELTFVGKPINPLAPRASAPNTIVTYCSNVNLTANICIGPCTVSHSDLPVCLNTPDTNCLSATNDVRFCDEVGCSVGCHDLMTECTTPLNNNFCYTPGTSSISVLAVA